jgi:hypothetical protein
MRGMDEEEIQEHTQNEANTNQYLEEFEFIGAHNHNEEYVRVNNFMGGGAQDSYSIIPFNNVQAHNPDSQYYEEEDIEGEISIEENKKTAQSMIQNAAGAEDMNGEACAPRDENDPVV